MLVVEDEPFISAFVEELLNDLGCIVVGPAATISEAYVLLNAKFDCAILDSNLAGVDSSPIATAIRERDIAFVIMTGHHLAPDQFPKAPLLRKPFHSSQFNSLLLACCRRI